MAIPSDVPTLPEGCRISKWLPRPLWTGAVTSVLVAVAAGLHLGIPVWRQHAAVREIENVGGLVISQPRGPTWLRDWLGNERMKLFDVVIEVDLDSTDATDATLVHASSLTGLQDLRLEDTRVTDAGLVNLKSLSYCQHGPGRG